MLARVARHPPVSTRRDARTPTMIVTTSLVVLLLAVQACLAASAQPTTPVTTVQTAPMSSAWIRQPRLSRCMDKPIGDLLIPHNKVADFQYAIVYGSTSANRLLVPTKLFSEDYKVSAKSSPPSLAARPSVLAELCSELPYLLYRSWPSSSPLKRNGKNVFDIATQGCELLANAFGSANQTHMATNPGAAVQTVSLRVIANSVAQIVDSKRASGNLAKNPFADKRSIEVGSVVNQVRARIVEKVTALQSTGGLQVKVLAAIKPFNLVVEVASPTYKTRPLLDFATTLRQFLLGVDTELTTLRQRRADGSFPWEGQEHKWTASVDLDDAAKKAMLSLFNRTKAHVSMDVVVTNATVPSTVSLALEKGTYVSGAVHGCALTNPTLSTSMGEPSSKLLPWYSTRLTARNTPLQLKNGPNSDVFVVSWHLPATSVPVGGLLQVLKTPTKKPIRVEFEFAATVQTGKPKCPSLPIIPVTIHPAYACADEYGFALKKDAKAPKYEKLASSEPLWSSEFVDYSQVEETFGDELDADFSEEDGLFEDDLIGEYSLGDEFALEDESAYSVDAAEDGAWDEDALDEDAGSDFSMEEDFMDGDGLDEADEADYAMAEEFIEDSLYGDD